jgi:hypothetical protein
MDRHNLKTFRTLLESFREKRPGDDPPCVLTKRQSSADPPFVEDRPPVTIPEEAYRDPDPPPKGTTKSHLNTVHEMDRHNLKTFRTLLESFRDKWPGDAPPCVLTEQQSSADPLFVEDRPLGAAYQDPDPPPKVTLQN